jgi:TonB-dependent starch-binding outer membrane protein SusC
MRKIVLLVTGMLFFNLAVLAQTKTVTGKVTEEKSGAPLGGANVQAKGSETVVKTGADGSFSINVPQNTRALVVTFVGYEREEVSLGNNLTGLSIALTPFGQTGEEVVVVGYGTQKKAKVTAAISKVAGSEISNLASTSFDKQLGGRAAGVQVISNSGLVSAPPTIRVRGYNSISQGRDPLFVIDGVPTFSGGASGVANTNVLADINPNDIESVEVLKDGAASAIYGSRAANGVVLITTKKGRSGKLSMNYDVYVGSSRAFNKPALLSATEFVTIANEKLTNAGLAAAANMNSENTNTNWLDNVFVPSPSVQSHTLSVAGGSDKSNYYMSLNYLSQEGIIRTNYNRRYNIRANMEHRPNRYIKVGNNITLSKTEDNDQNNGGNALSGAMGAAMRALPNVRIFNPANPTGYNLTAANDALGSDANTRVIENNYVNIAYVLDKNKFANDRYRIINNAFLEISPIRELSIRTQGTIDYINATDFQSLDKTHGDGRGSAGSIFNQSVQATTLTWQNYATYTKNIQRHSITAVAGVEMQRIINRNFSGSGTNISDPFFQTDNLITNTYVNQFSGGFYQKRGFQSYFGRLNYDFGSRYFASFSIRRDGLSSLAPANRYGNFYGGSLGWKVSEESFWQNSGINKIVNDFKIRGSYAQVGNVLGAAFPFLSTYGPAPYGGISGNAANRQGNPDLRWETNKKLNIGVDLSFLKNRFFLNFDYFVNKNDGQVLDELQPVSLGVPGNIITKNIGTMENKGIELTLGGDVLKKKDFSWNININYTKLNNEVLSLTQGQTEQLLAGPNNGTFNILRVGQSINAIYGYKYAGVNSGNGNAMWFKEDGSLVQYNNVSGAAAGYYGVIKADDPALGPATTLGNRYIIGSPIPTWFGGITNTVNYKNLSMEIFLRYSGGNDVYNLTRQEVWNSQGFVNNGTEVLNRWTPTNRNTDVPKLFYGRDNQVNLQGQANGRFLESGDFLRLQNLIIAYKFDNKKLEQYTKGFVKSARFFVQGQNLHVWTKYTGIDPENFTELGIDNSSVPQLRTFTFGVNVGF